MFGERIAELTGEIIERRRDRVLDAFDALRRQYPDYVAALDGRPSGWVEEPSRQALAQVPHAAQWARSFARDIPISPKARYVS